MRPVILAIAVLLPATSVAAAQTSAPRVSITTELRLDAAAEDFPAVSRVFVGPQSQIIVPLVMDGQLRLYDSSGKRIAVVGRPGGGPGEFLSIGAAGWAGETLWVSDPMQARTTYFTPDSKVVRTVLWPVGGRIEGEKGGAISRFIPHAILSDGSMLGKAWWTSRHGREEGLILRDMQLPIRLILPMLSGPSAPWWISMDCCGFAVPFALPPQYSFAFDGRYFGELSAPIPTRQNGTFTVTLFRATGDTVYSRSFAYRGERIPQRAADSALAVVVPAPGHLVNVPADLPQRVRAVARVRMPSWYIAVESILLGLDRTAWVGFRPTNEGRRYLILTSRGDPVGSLLVPRSTHVRQATASHIWVTETDTDGLSSVVRYRLAGLSCSPGNC